MRSVNNPIASQKGRLLSSSLGTGVVKDPNWTEQEGQGLGWGWETEAQTVKKLHSNACSVSGKPWQ